MLMQPAFPTTVSYRSLATIALALALVGGGVAYVATGSASAQVELDSLDASDANHTLDGDLEDVTLDADVTFDHSVPDADRRYLTLTVGPDEDSLEELTFIHEPDPQGTDSGTVELTESLFEADAYSRADFEPPIAGNTSREVVVAAELVIERENGQEVTATETDTMTLTLRDGTDLDASVGGTVDTTVSES